MNSQTIATQIINTIFNKVTYTGNTEHSNQADEMRPLMNALALADKYSLGVLAISYYNHVYLPKVYKTMAVHYTVQHQGTRGTLEDGLKLIALSTGDMTMELNKAPEKSLVEQIRSKTAWGRKEIQTLPYGSFISEEMKKNNKTNVNSNFIIHFLFKAKAQETGFLYYNEFKEMMDGQKTMISKQTAQDLLKEFWNNTKEDYKHNPTLFNNIKEVIIELNESLISSNSSSALSFRFMEYYINKN